MNISGTIYYEDDIIFEDLLSKIAIALPLYLSLGAFPDTCSEQIHSGKLILKLIFKDDGRS